jgi:Protein of unknown function (DUF2393)
MAIGYNPPMGGLIEPSPLSEPQDSNWRPILASVAVVLVLMALIAWFLRSQPRAAGGPPPYAANIKFSDLKMSQAQNFVGATVTYIEGTVTNSGDKTVTHVVVHVIFQDAMGEVAQLEDVPLHVQQPTGPYQDAVDLSASPLAPGQSKPFRLTFEHVSANWNQAYPDLRVTDVTVK